MIAVILTACSILYSGGPISSFNAPELKEGTCREFKIKVNPEYTAVGMADNPIIVDMTPKFITPFQCQKYGTLAIENWIKTDPSAANAKINKWRCDAHVERDDI